MHPVACCKQLSVKRSVMRYRRHILIYSLSGRDGLSSVWAAWYLSTHSLLIRPSSWFHRVHLISLIYFTHPRGCSHLRSALNSGGQSVSNKQHQQAHLPFPVKWFNKRINGWSGVTQSVASLQISTVLTHSCWVNKSDLCLIRITGHPPLRKKKISMRNFQTNR